MDSFVGVERVLVGAWETGREAAVVVRFAGGSVRGDAGRLGRGPLLEGVGPVLDGGVDEEAVADHGGREGRGEGDGDDQVDAEAVEAAGDAEERKRHESEHEIVVANHKYIIVYDK